MIKTALALCTALGLTAVAVQASIDPPLDVNRQTRGANKIVLATVVDVNAVFGENEFGDQLILSHVTMQVDETLKGAQESTVVVTLEGGTVGDVRLDVSDMPRMERGHRAVMFLLGTPSGQYVPYGRGSGVLGIGADNRAIGSGLTIDDIRSAVAAARARGGR